MIRKDNPLLELWEFTQEEIVQIKQTLATPLVQAYIKSLVSDELTAYLLGDLATIGDSYDDKKILINNAFNRGLVALAKRLIIISPQERSIQTQGHQGSTGYNGE